MRRFVIAALAAVVMSLGALSVGAAERGGQVSDAMLARMGMGGMPRLSDAQGKQIRGKGFIVAVNAVIIVQRNTGTSGSGGNVSGGGGGSGTGGSTGAGGIGNVGNSGATGSGSSSGSGGSGGSAGSSTAGGLSQSNTLSLQPASIIQVIFIGRN